MGIKFACPHCNEPLNIKAKLAGLRGYCPECQGVIQIPSTDATPPSVSGSSSTSRSAAITANVLSAQPVTGQGSPPSGVSGNAPVANAPTPVAESRPDPIAEAPDSVWYVRPKIGGQFGPASGDLMRRWLTEGRVGHDSLVWRDGWADWLEAERVFPQLSPMPPENTPVAVAASDDMSISKSVSKSVAYKQHRKSQSNRMLALLIVGSIITGILVIVLMFVL